MGCLNQPLASNDPQNDFHWLTVILALMFPQGLLAAACSGLAQCHSCSVTSTMYAILHLAMIIHTGCQHQLRCQWTWLQLPAGPWSLILAGKNLLPQLCDGTRRITSWAMERKAASASRCRSEVVLPFSSFHVSDALSVKVPRWP